MKIAIALSAAALLVGCATMDADYAPRLEASGRDQAQVENDLLTCQIMQRNRPGGAGMVAMDSVYGAVVGGLISPVGAIVTSGALIGGATSSSLTPRANAQEYIDKCMKDRGYKLLS